ncbi:MAG: phytol kinase [Acidobacteriota bacterium]
MILGALVALVWSYACLSFAAHFKPKVRLRTGYTRKLFHVLIFTTAVFVQAIGGFWAVCLFGFTVAFVVGFAVFRGQGNRLYEALAREQDGPDRTYYIVVSYVATMIGGMTSNVIFGPLAVVGYLVGGLGDAAGEPAGARWGRHPYKVSLNGAIVTKTFEGSLAVMAASVVALLIAVEISPQLSFDLRSFILVPLIAIVCTLVEGFSPRGWDNVSMQVVPTLLAATLLR